MNPTDSLDAKIKRIIKAHPDLFPTEAKFWAWLRGGLRRGLWEKSSLKLKFKNKNVSPPPPDYTGRGKKGDYCALTGVWTPTSKLEVDHKDGNLSLKCSEDILPFIAHLLAEDCELQLVDKEAHKIKSYAERPNISFEQAQATKQAIAIQKDRKKESEWFAENNIKPASNAKKRREQIINHLLQEE